MLIDVTNVTHRYPGRRQPVLRHLSVRLSEPRIGVIGANGSGKSTFARLLNGLVVPEQGEVTVDGLDTRTKGRVVRSRVGFCFTDPDAQIVMPTVAEDVAFGLRRRGLSKTEITARVDAALSTYRLEGYADRPAHLLSGGEKQLLALAAVLVTEPRLVVLDEPTTLLDLRNARIIAEVLRELSQQIVLVSHQVELLSDFDRVLVFDNAKLVYDGEAREAIEHYQELMS